MNETQRIRFTLKDKQFKEISKGKGVLSFHLVDELGRDRIVKAQAKLNWFKKIHSVRPMYHRETPLVNALVKTKLNETIQVDFTEYNKKFPRGSVHSQKLSVIN